MPANDLSEIPLERLVAVIRRLDAVQAQVEAAEAWDEFRKRLKLCQRFKGTEATYVRDILGIPHADPE